MVTTRDPKDYADIINLPRHEPVTRPRMPMEKRAAQFSPFVALTGYAEMLEKTIQEHERKVESGEMVCPNLRSSGAVKDGGATAKGGAKRPWSSEPTFLCRVSRSPSEAGGDVGLKARHAQVSPAT